MLPIYKGGGPGVVVSTAAFHARVRGSVPSLGGLKETKMLGSLRDREVACSASDRQGSNFESCVWRTVSSQSSHHPQKVLLAQFSLYVHKGGLKPDSFHFFPIYKLRLGQRFLYSRANLVECSACVHAKYPGTQNCRILVLDYNVIIQTFCLQMEIVRPSILDPTDDAAFDRLYLTSPVGRVSAVTVYYQYYVYVYSEHDVHKKMQPHFN